MLMFNLQKRDALEFVKSLEGGWDCVIYDPPYLNDELNNTYDVKKEYMKGANMEWKRTEDMFHRLEIDQKYLQLLRAYILSKIDNCLFVEFNKNLRPEDYYFLWYKGRQYGSMGMGYSKQSL